MNVKTTTPHGYPWFQWALVAIVAVPAILSSPWAILYLDPVRAVYKALGFNHFIAAISGCIQLAGGAMLVFPKTFKLGLLNLGIFGLFILISKTTAGIPEQALEEILLLLLILLLSWLGHPKQ